MKLFDTGQDQMVLKPTLVLPTDKDRKHVVHLSKAEVIVGASLGFWWTIESKFDNRQHQVKNDIPWQTNIEGSLGEMAFSKYMGIYWGGSINTFKRVPDIGEYEVRTRSKHEYELNVRPGDVLNRKFVLLTGRFPVYWVRGWAFGYEAAKEEYLQTFGYEKPAYFLPHKKLRPIETIRETPGGETG